MGGNLSSEKTSKQHKVVGPSSQYVSFKLNKVFSVYIFQSQKHQPWEIFCKVKIGDQEQKTRPETESPTKVPSWSYQVKTFKIPNGVQSGIIEVYQIHKGITTKLGYVNFDIDTISEGHEIHEYNEKLESCLPKKTVGSINFQTQGSKNGHPHFCDPVSAILPRHNSGNREDPTYRQFWEVSHAEGFVTYKRKESIKDDKELTEQERIKHRASIKKKLLEPLPLLDMKILKKHHTTYEKVKYKDVACPQTQNQNMKKQFENVSQQH